MDISYTFTEEETTYTIEIGRTHPLVDERIEKDSSDQWVILTAENPWGQEFPHFINKQRNSVMRKALQQSMWNWIEGLGQADGFPDEVVFLVWGITVPEAVLMANQMEQSAIVKGFSRGYAEVVELLTDGSSR